MKPCKALINFHNTYFDTDVEVYNNQVFYKLLEVLNRQDKG